jgi:hypothetical protein
VSQAVQIEKDIIVSQNKRSHKGSFNFGGGKDSAERKVTKCHVSREGRTPHHESDGGFNSPKTKKPLKEDFYYRR